MPDLPTLLRREAERLARELYAAFAPTAPQVTPKHTGRWLDPGGGFAVPEFAPTSWEEQSEEWRARLVDAHLALLADLTRPASRACLRMALAEGKGCRACGGSGIVGDRYMFTDSNGEACEADEHERCAACEGTGYLRPPAPHHWIGAESEGGALTPAHAAAAGMSLDELAAALLVRAAERVVAGLSGITGLRGAWRVPVDCTASERRSLAGDVIAVTHESLVCWTCDGEGECAGDYFADDGMSPCRTCRGRGSFEGPGWWLVGTPEAPGPSGPETGLAGRIAADHAALAASFALLGDAEGRPALLLPEVT